MVCGPTDGTWSSRDFVPPVQGTRRGLVTGSIGGTRGEDDTGDPGSRQGTGWRGGVSGGGSFPRSDLGSRPRVPQGGSGSRTGCVG